MPELAEVEFYRRQWDAGLGQPITKVHLHETKRVFRGVDTTLVKRLRGEKLEISQASGKQMLFQLSGNFWLGIHLGMTGRLHAETSDYQPQKQIGRAHV